MLPSLCAGVEKTIETVDRFFVYRKRQDQFFFKRETPLQEI